ncbi:HugZ family protein [Nocardia sp. NPDC101769]|uniref:HugZ family pyridoxamine 5'-phosphate oxidase n=1 Tax=Nocardia sp. NPDC101769 TaxID=3364333 RepID=UPI003813FDCC
MALDHGDPGDAPSTPPPLTPIANTTRPSAADEARTVAAATNTATLATLSADGGPWASFVTYGLLAGQPVLCVSRMAEHGRNLAADPRASLSIVTPELPEDPLAGTRLTLAGVAERPQGEEAVAARAAHLAAVPAAKTYIDFSDFTVWVLRVQRARWVGGYGRMDSATADEYAAAQADPIIPGAARAIAHLNDDHADALLDMAHVRGGYPDASAAVCERADRFGLDLRVTTPRGIAVTRIGYLTPIDSIADLRTATVDLARASRPE